MKLEFFGVIAVLFVVAVLLAVFTTPRGEPHKLFTAMADIVAPQAGVASQLRVTALANGEAELLVYGQIGETFWGGEVTAASVVRQLEQITASTIRVRINSPGGVVADGAAIYNVLKAHAARIVVVIEGQACSIASLIACAGDEVLMPANALVMIHAPGGALFGNAVELREAANTLDTHAEAMATSYATKTGKPLAEILALLSDGKDHWMTAAQAVEFGIADRVLEDAPAQLDNASAAAALIGYCTAIAAAPTRVSAALRQRLAAECSPTLFASIPEAAQLAIVANTEDVAMKTSLLHIMAAAAAAAAPATAGAGATDIPAVAPGAPVVAGADPTATAIAAIASRNQRVSAVLADVIDVAGVRELRDSALMDPTMSIESIQARALALAASAASPASGGAGRVQGGEDQRDKFMQGATNAILARGNLMPREAGNEFNGLALTQLVAISLERAGISARGMSPNQLASRVMAMQSSGDFPLLLSNVAGRALRAAYESYANTYQLWCAVGSVSDFKANPRIQLGSFNNLATIAEGGEYTYGSLAEESETVTAVTKGKALRMTRQMLVNDDLGGFLRRAALLGRAAARTVNSDVYTLIGSAAGLGPTMSDGGTLFNATAQTTAGGHGNYLALGTAPTVAAISAGRAAMRKQKDKSLREALNIAPRFLLAPVALEDAAWALLNSTADPASSNSGKRNYVRDVANLTLVTDPALDAISTTAWTLAADPMDAPLVEVDFLDGIQTPYIDEQIDFDSDSIKLKTRLDYGMAAIDWRGGYRNNGTGG
jgi:ATP-dependent Clp endopeptidase proteolytic subunit ClpP